MTQNAPGHEHVDLTPPSLLSEPPPSELWVLGGRMLYVVPGLACFLLRLVEKIMRDSPSLSSIIRKQLSTRHVKDLPPVEPH